VMKVGESVSWSANMQKRDIVVGEVEGLYAQAAWLMEGIECCNRAVTGKEIFSCRRKCRKEVMNRSRGRCESISLSCIW